MHPFLNASLGWLAAAAAALLFVGVGRALARVCGQPRCGTAVAFTAGAWAISIPLMALAFDDGLRRWEAGLAFGLAAAIAVFVRRRSPRPQWRAAWWPAWPPAWRPGRRWPAWLWVLLLVGFLAPYLIQTLLPDTDWDAAMYHRPAARRFLERGVMHVDPYRAQLNFPGAIPVLYMPFLAFGLESALTPFNFLGIAVLVVAVYEVGRTTLGRRGAALAVALVLTTNIVLELGLDHRSDGFLALFYFACFQASYAFWRRSERVGLLPLLGMAMGMTIGTKLTGLLAVGLFGGAALAVMLVRRPPRYRSWFGAALVCLLVPGSFWIARNAIVLDDPVYPFLNGLLYYDAHHELRPFYPDFEKLYATAEKPPAKFLPDPGGQKEAGTILDLADVFAHHSRYQNKQMHWLQPLLFLAFLLPFLDRRPKRLMLAGAGCLCFLVLGARAHLVRYALPAYPMLALGAAAVLTHARVRRSRLRAPVLWATAVWIGGTAVHNTTYEWIKLDRMYPLDYLLGREIEYAWRAMRGYNTDPTTGILAHRVNQLVWDGKMSARDTILMVAESKVELFLCGTIPDVSAELYPFLVEYLKAGGDYRRLRENLFGMGVRYILINRQQIGWALTGLKMASKLQNRDYMRFGAFHAIRFGMTHGTRLIEHVDYELFRIE